MAPEEDSESFYSVLGIRKDSSAAEIRRAYRKLAKKWHPDKWSKTPSLAEQAKLRFQKIQEAYSVLSDDTKRVMYDAGLYEPSEDEDGFSDFLDEMASMMANVRDQSSREDSFEELQQMFTQMVNDSWFSTNSFQPSEPPWQQPVLSREPKQQPPWENFEFFNEMVDNEKWDDHSYPDFDLDIEEANICSAVQDHQASEAQRDAEEYRRQKKPRLCCDCDPCKQGTGMGFGGGLRIPFGNERSRINSYPTFAFVA